MTTRTLFVALLTISTIACMTIPVRSSWLTAKDAPGVVGDGVISLPATHDAPSGFDRTTDFFYFTRADASFERSAVYRISLAGDDAPELAPFSTSAYDAGASFHPGDDQVLFTSRRRTDNADTPDDWNIWVASRDSSSASSMPTPVNSAFSECCATFDRDGTFLFSSNREGSWDIFRARRVPDGSFSVVRLGGSINSEHDEWPASVSPDGHMVLFNSTRPDGYGGDDIYAACRSTSAPEHWTAHRLPSPVNTEAYEDSAMLTPDGATLVWSSWRPRDTGERRADVYAISAKEAGLPGCR